MIVLQVHLDCEAKDTYRVLSTVTHSRNGQMRFVANLVLIRAHFVVLLLARCHSSILRLLAMKPHRCDKHTVWIYHLAIAHGDRHGSCCSKDAGDYAGLTHAAAEHILLL